MDDFNQRIVIALDPYGYKKSLELESGELRLAHYTSAENAVNIIAGRQFWLRSAATMNDFREIEYGIEAVHTYFNGPSGPSWKKYFDSVDKNLWDRFERLFQELAIRAKYHTYIASFSEHGSNEDQYGRLSMWRAYGGENNVALIFRGKTFAQETSAMGVFGLPVRYFTQQQFSSELDAAVQRLSEIDPEPLGRELHRFEYWVAMLLFHGIIGTKHPGFEEEREWRIFYSPEHPWNKWKPKELKFTSIGGVPQSYLPIRLEKDQNPEIPKIEIKDILDRVLVGPSPNSRMICVGMNRVLSEAGLKDTTLLVKESNIPFRRN